MDVADPACAVMLEKIVPENRLLAFIVSNDHDARLLRTKLRDEKRLQIDILTIKDPTPLRGHYPREFLDRFGDVGMQGYLSDQIVCPDVVRASLNHFSDLHNVLWARHTAHIPEDRLEALCPQPNSPKFTVLLHKVPARRPSAGGREAPDVTIFSGSRSRYAPTLPPTISSLGVTGRAVVGRAVEESGERKKQLEQRLEAHRAQRAEFEKALNETKGRIRTLEDDISVIRGERADIARQLKLPQVRGPHSHTYSYPHSESSSLNFIKSKEVTSK